MVNIVKIYSDGACSGNPGPGGWGTIVTYGGYRKEIKGGKHDTTNNQMEMVGVIEGLKLLKKPCTVIVTTDSQYVTKGMSEWIEGWIKKGWKTAGRKPVKNRKLWEELLKVSKGHDVEWKWVRGHNGHKENERCDKLATSVIP